MLKKLLVISAILLSLGCNDRRSYVTVYINDVEIWSGMGKVVVHSRKNGIIGECVTVDSHSNAGNIILFVCDDSLKVVQEAGAFK